MLTQEDAARVMFAASKWVEAELKWDGGDPHDIEARRRYEAAFAELVSSLTEPQP